MRRLWRHLGGLVWMCGLAACDGRPDDDADAGPTAVLVETPDGGVDVAYPEDGCSEVACVEPPHIVLILADDLGYGDVGAFNPDSAIPTPHIDALAAEGMRFTDAHAPGAVCTPTRYGLLTGRYPFRNQRVWDEGLVDPDRLTVAELLQEAGYQTDMVGKWHLSFEGGSEYDYDAPLRRGPVDQGFDRWFGIPASLDIAPYFYVRDDEVVSPPTRSIDDGPHDVWGQGPFWRAGLIAEGFEMAQVLPTLRDEAVARIEAHVDAAGDAPLFLYLALTAPHTPWLPGEAQRGRSGAGEYGDFVVAVDDVVGDVLAALEAGGMTEDTLVIFTSDNGPYWLDADRERFGHDAAGGLRGMKGDAWEAGHRVPFVARWPGRIPGGTLNPGLLSLTDLMATFATIAGGLPLPHDAAEDSVDMTRAWIDPAETSIRQDLVVESSNHTRVLRRGRWKWIPQLGSAGFSEPELIEPEDGGPTGQLYDLEADPTEQENLFDAHPEQVQQLQAALDALVAAGRSR